MSNLIARFVKDESGATAIEYGLIAALIALAIIVGAGALGNAINGKFTENRQHPEHHRQLICRIAERSDCVLDKGRRRGGPCFICCQYQSSFRSGPHQSLIEHA